MDDEIKQLKSLLRSLVVSSPTQMDVRSLLRDYRNMVGEPIPIAKFGHKDPVAFLRERCNDSFLFTGPSSNPVLTLIVPDTLKHIDQFVQRQKVPSTSKFKSKRRSVPEAAVAVPKDNIFKSFVSRNSSAPAPAAVPAPVPTHAPAPVPAPAPSAVPAAAPTVRARTAPARGSTDPETNRNNTVTSNDVQNFLKKRIPQYIDLQAIDDGTDGTGSLALDDDELDSGRHTSSSSASTKARQLEELKAEIMELISAAPGGVWCTDLIRLYRERFERELNFKRFGYNSILSVAYALEPRVAIARPDPTGDWLLQDRARAPAPRARPQPRAPPAPPAPAPDPDDALPGIDFDPDVFPEDCVSFCDSIPPLALDDCVPGAMLEVIVGEVYSPSHFWLIRLGQNYNIAMEDMMDDMTRYYNGPGAARALARGAVRVGHYCSSLYENDWHRSLIVKILDSDTVKVRHVDYGTVDTVRVAALRPLRRCWARLPAQAVRARLAAVRPCSAGRRWPPPAARHFLGLVQDARFVANVVARDLQEELLEVLLIDTRAEDDRCVSAALVRAGHADPRADSALRTAECYLYPRFEALENADTPNLAEICAYLHDGIALDYVEAYRRHVPMCLPPLAPAPARAPARPAPRPAAPVSAAAPRSAPSLPRSIPPSSPPALSPPTMSPPATSPPAAPAVASAGAPVPPSSPPPSPARLPAATPTPPPASASVSPPAASPSVLSTGIPLLWPGPGPVPPPGYGWGAGAGGGGAVLSVAECATYSRLASVNPEAARWYMAGALGRALAAPLAAPPPGPWGAPPLPPWGAAWAPRPPAAWRGPAPAAWSAPPLSLLGPPPGFGA